MNKFSFVILLTFNMKAFFLTHPSFLQKLFVVNVPTTNFTPCIFVTIKGVCFITDVERSKILSTTEIR